MREITSHNSSARRPDSNRHSRDHNIKLFGHVWDLIAEPKQYPSLSALDEHRDAHWFIYLFSPRLDMYAVPFGFPNDGRGWSTHNHTLSLEQIENAFNGSSSIGWFSSRSPRMICLEIDADPFSWSPKTDPDVINSALRKDYECTISQFPVPPSMVALGHHGLYVYYLLEDSIFHETLEVIVSSILRDSSATFRQITSVALPVPKKKEILDSTTLAPARWGLYGGTDWECVPVYHPSRLFGAHWISRLVVTTIPTVHYVSGEPAAEKNSQMGNMGRKMPTFEEVETHILPFESGMGEEQLFVAVIACHNDGLNADQTLQKVLTWFENSPLYTGPLSEMAPYELDQRIRTIRGLSHLVRWPSSSADNTLPDVEHVVELHRFSPESAPAIRHFLIELARWQKLHDQVGENPDMLAMLNDKFPFYRHHRCLGLYPLPSELLSSWAPDYSRYIEWLIDLGILHDAGLQYNADGICKYYFITFADVHIENR
jgi:hypothetical protein